MVKLLEYLLDWVRERTGVGKVLTLFCSYMVVALAFGGIYFWIYISNPNSFKFNSDIIQGREAEVMADLKLQEDCINMLPEIKTAIQKGEVVLDPYQLSIGGRRVNIFSYFGDYLEYRFRFRITRYPKERQHIISMSLTDTLTGYTRDFIGRFTNVSTQLSANDFAIVLTDFEDKARKEFLQHLHQVQNNDKWSYFDFLYFSFITLATVGYGDILPNNTLVRVVVIAEIVVGLCITTFMLALVFSNNNRHSRTIEPD